MVNLDLLNSDDLCITEVETDASVAEGFDADLCLAEHLVIDCNKPTLWALQTLASHGRIPAPE